MAKKVQYLEKKFVTHSIIYLGYRAGSHSKGHNSYFLDLKKMLELLSSTTLLYQRSRFLMDRHLGITGLGWLPYNLP